MILIYSTFGSKEEALKVARLLVRSGLVACCNVVPRTISVYQWHDELQEEEECILLIKTKESTYSDVEQMIVEHHSYDCPAVFSFPVEQAHEPYLNWINSVVNG